MTNTDECRATHWRCVQPLAPRPLYILSLRASDWDSEVSVDLFFFRMTGDQQEHKRQIEICGRQRNREAWNSKARWCWNGSIASKNDLNISCFFVWVSFAVVVHGILFFPPLHDNRSPGWLRGTLSPAASLCPGGACHINRRTLSFFPHMLQAMTWVTDAFNPPAAQYGNRSAGFLWWWRPHLVRNFSYFEMYEAITCDCDLQFFAVVKAQELHLWRVTSPWCKAQRRGYAVRHDVSLTFWRASCLCYCSYASACYHRFEVRTIDLSSWFMRLWKGSDLVDVRMKCID